VARQWQRVPNNGHHGGKDAGVTTMTHEVLT
jgi:hypothetical protein